MLYQVTGRHLTTDFAVGEAPADAADETDPDAPTSEEDFVSLFKDTFDAHEVREEAGPMKMDMNKMLKQVQEMQEQMAKAQEELAGETVEASAGGGMVRVKATGGGEIVEIKIAPEAIDPDDPEMLEDLVLAAVNEALRNAQELMQSKLGGALGGLGGLGGLGLPGL